MALLVSSCSQMSREKQPFTPSLRSSDPPKVWSLSAKLGVRTPEKNGSVRIEWHQNHKDYTVQVFNSFGSTLARITGDSQFIQIDRPGKESLYSNTPDQLIQEVFSWDIPLDFLRYWVLGFQHPNRDSTAIIINANGSTIKLQQAGWEIHFDRFERVRDWVLPNKTQAFHDDIQLTVLVKSWDIPPQ